MRLHASSYGFSSAMLGVTGFETSANFVEEQEPGVYTKTLRNMVVAATCLNPTMSFLSFMVLPYSGAWACVESDFEFSLCCRCYNLSLS